MTRTQPTLRALASACLLLTFGSVLVGSAGASTSASISRSLSTSTPNCGDTLTITLQVTWHQTPAPVIGVEEHLPAGWVPFNPSHEGSTAAPGRVKWFLRDPSVTSLSYFLAIPSDARGTYSLAGLYRDEGMTPAAPDRVVAGPTSVTMSCPTPHGAGMVRGNLEPRTCRDPLSIVLFITWPGTTSQATLAVVENFPASWQVTRITSGGTIEPGKARWTLMDNAVTFVRYDLAMPDGTVGTFAFSGTYTVNGGAARTIAGDTNIQITSCPAPASSTTSPSSTLTPPPSGPFHSHDTNQDCVMGDSELFSLIAAWKTSSGGGLDTALFAAIAHWKISPGRYC
jgi:hypothetical protein